MDDRIKQIRESEKKSHIEMYSNEALYQTDSWLKKPIKAVTDLLPLFQDYQNLKVLDLGCGVGRNSIHIAREYKYIDCTIDCVDILELAIEKLLLNANGYDVHANINGIIQAIEEYPIPAQSYDFIMAISALEHVATKDAFTQKLEEIKNGIRANGVVCLIINSGIEEKNKFTGEVIPAQFEINLPTQELQSILNQTFVNWSILKSTVQKQQYNIPREFGVSDLTTNVVSFIAQKRN